MRTLWLKLCPDQLLQPGISGGPSLHLLRHRRSLHVFLQHLPLLQGVPDRQQAALHLRGRRRGRPGVQPKCQRSWPAALAPPQHSAVGTRTIASSWVQRLHSSLLLFKKNILSSSNTKGFRYYLCSCEAVYMTLNKLYRSGLISQWLNSLKLPAHLNDKPTVRTKDYFIFFHFL